MTDIRCECGRMIRHVPPGRRARRLTLVGSDWEVVAVGSSRWHVHKLRQRHPDYEFRSHRISLYGGDDSDWTIEARRRP